MTPKCSFRMIGLSEAQLQNIIDLHLEQFKYRTGSDFRDKTRKVLRIPLDDRIDSKLLKMLLSESPEGVYYDFFISVSSREQTAIVEIPDFVLSLHSSVGGKICFSYTCVI